MDTGAPYNESYYASHLGEPYHRGNSAWPVQFGRIADLIVERLAPRTVLDAGCAIGFLVEALRLRGVEASGVDISEYAIGEVPRELTPYFRVGSVTEDFQRDYDLIVCIEVLEHLSPEDGDTAIANLAAHTGTVLFSSTPDDFDESTHLNVRPGSYWVERFGRHGLYRDLDFDASFVAPHAMLLRRDGQGATAAIARYEDAFERERARAAMLERRVLELESLIGVGAWRIYAILRAAKRRAARFGSRCERALKRVPKALATLRLHRDGP